MRFIPWCFAMTAWTAHVTVATVIEQDGKFLFVEEQTEGETIIDAAIRETMEETGYRIEIESLLGIYTYTPPLFPDRTYYRFCFIGKVLEHIPNAQLDTGIIGAVWMSLDELLETARARSPLVIKALQDAQAGKRYPLSLIDVH